MSHGALNDPQSKPNGPDWEKSDERLLGLLEGFAYARAGALAGYCQVHRVNRDSATMQISRLVEYILNGKNVAWRFEPARDPGGDERLVVKAWARTFVFTADGTTLLAYRVDQRAPSWAQILERENQAIVSVHERLPVASSGTNPDIAEHLRELVQAGHRIEVSEGLAARFARDVLGIRNGAVSPAGYQVIREEILAGMREGASGHNLEDGTRGLAVAGDQRTWFLRQGRGDTPRAILYWKTGEGRKA